MPRIRPRMTLKKRLVKMPKTKSQPRKIQRTRKLPRPIPKMLKKTQKKIPRKTPRKRPRKTPRKKPPRKTPRRKMTRPQLASPVLARSHLVGTNLQRQRPQLSFPT
jgi:hypothetical protein